MRKLGWTSAIEFFRKPKLSQTERVELLLKERQAARESLARRLDTAEMFVTDKREVGERLALDGASDQALGRAEAATRAAEDRARTLRAALSQLDEQIAATERQLRMVVERRYRDTVADWLEARAAAIAEAAPGYDAGSSALIEAVTKSAAALPEANPLAADLEAMRCEVALVVERISTELRTAAARTRLGEAQIAFWAPPEAANALSPETAREAISASSQYAASMSEKSEGKSVPQASSTGSVEQVDVSDPSESASSVAQADASSIKDHAAA